MQTFSSRPVRLLAGLYWRGLIGLILVQAKGTGLSGVFGGEGNVFRTKRGAERVIFIATIIVVALFFGVAILNVYTHRS